MVKETRIVTGLTEDQAVMEVRKMESDGFVAITRKLPSNGSYKVTGSQIRGRKYELSDIENRQN